MHYRVELTQEDIDKGKVCEPASCPVARAINRLDIPGMVRIAVGPRIGYVYRDEGRDPLFFELPMEARTFIRSFDTKLDPVVPFSFDVEMVGK